MPAVRVDDAMGTTLALHGLPPGTPADRWVLERPDEVRAVHQAFVDSGSQAVRTATLCTRIDQDPSGFELLQEAVAIAASTRVAEIWLSIGPAGPRRGPIEGLLDVARLPVDKLLLETFVDPDECVQATRLLSATGIPVIASLVARPDGRLLDGRAYPTRALREAGAAILGINCGADAMSALACFEASHDGGPWFVAPAFGPRFAEVLAALVPVCAYVGGCCGVGPAELERAWPR